MLLSLKIELLTAGITTLVFVDITPSFCDGEDPWLVFPSLIGLFLALNSIGFNYLICNGFLHAVEVVVLFKSPPASYLDYTIKL